MPELHLYIGTYTSYGGEGIYLYAFDPASGSLTHRKTMLGVVNPSFLAIGPQGRCLYAVNEVETYYGRPEGALSAFVIDPGGDLRFLNQQSSQGASPCHLSLDHTGRHVFVANYGGGSVAVFPLRGDGGLGPVSSHAAHNGSGPNPDRQRGPHAHCVVPDPFNRHVLAVDLGSDSVIPYVFDPEWGTLRAGAPALRAKPGSGPRQLAFHPDGNWAYVVHELEPRLTVYRYNGMTGSLAETQSVSCLPDGVACENFASTLAVDPRGGFLYVSNRGHDAIAHFRIDRTDGSLAFAGSASTRGRYPRHFTLDPGGRFLFAANQRSDSIAVFRVDPDSGALEFTGAEASVPAPVCVLAHAPAQR